MKTQRAPRIRKRLACDVKVGGGHYKGIILDISAAGLFVQTNARLKPGECVEVCTSLPGTVASITFEATVARRNAVPPQLVTVAKGGVGLVIEEPPKEYLDFIAEASPAQAEFVETARRDTTLRDGRAASGSTKREERSGPGGSEAALPPPKRFRIHAVDTRSGEKNTFLAISANEEEARTQLREELGDEWQVLFIEHV